jgi:hypothetical protein
MASWLKTNSLWNKLHAEKYVRSQRRSKFTNTHWELNIYIYEKMSISFFFLFNDQDKSFNYQR